jgi:dihydroxyacetone kinase
MEMAGMSISILKLDDELEKLLLEKANCPFWY